MNSLKSWGFMRMLRFGFGSFAIIQSIIISDFVLGFLGVIVGGMAFFNIGCCGIGGCDTNYKNTNSKNQITDIEYEEVV